MILAMKGIPHSQGCCSWSSLQQMWNEDRQCCESLDEHFRCGCWFFGFELSCWERGQCGIEMFLPFSCYSAVSLRTSEKSEHEQLVDSNSVFPVAPHQCTTPFAHMSDLVIKHQKVHCAKFLSFFLFLVLSLINPCVQHSTIHMS